MIYGIGKVEKEMENKTSIFRIMPSKILGFAKVQKRMIDDSILHGKHSRRGGIDAFNSDLMDRSLSMVSARRVAIKSNQNE